MKSGKFLIATPSIMCDTNFHRAVILLVDHKIDGTIGFILNKKLEYTLNDVISKSKKPSKFTKLFRSSSISSGLL